MSATEADAEGIGAIKEDLKREERERRPLRSLSTVCEVANAAHCPAAPAQLAVARFRPGLKPASLRAAQQPC